MSYGEWIKKKREGESSTDTPSTSSSQTVSGTSENSQAASSYGEWIRKKKETSSLQGWTESAKSLLNETQNYFNTWRKYDDTDEEYSAISDRRTKLLAQADSWRKMYAGNEEAIAHIDSVVSALAESSNLAMKGFDYYSKWATNDDYQKAIRESGYFEKYEGKSYDDILSTLGQMEDGEEKEWLTRYGSLVDRNEKLALDLGAAGSEIEELEDFYDKAVTVGTWYASYLMNPGAWDQDTINEQMSIYNELQEKYGGSVSEIEKLIKKKQQYLNSAYKVQQWYPLSSVNDPNSEYYDPDFKKYSGYVSNVSYGLGGKPSFKDETYAWINNPTVEDKRIGGGMTTARAEIESTRAAYTWDTPNRNRDSEWERKYYDYMTDDEVAIYNYHYAKNGKDKANAYLESLSETLEARANNETIENAANFAKAHPFVSSTMSIAFSVGSGFEYIGDLASYAGDVITGEKNPRMGTNEYALTTNAIRGTVSDMVDWEIRNWDAFDFVYNTTMSGLDSAAAALTFGNMGGVVLGLSAAAQGTNDALARGMSDGQAFWNGLFSGVFEGLFETLSIGQFNSLKEVAPESVKDIIKNLGKSMLVNASEEMLTEFANITYDALINGEFANYTWDELMNGAWKQAALQIIESGASGMLMGLGFGAAANVGGYYNGKSAKAEALYGSDPGALVGESIEINPDNRFARRMQTRLDNGKTLSGGQMNRLMNQNEKALRKQDLQTIQSATESRLTELGETGDITAIAAALTKQVVGKKLSNSESQLIAESKYGQRVANELNTENIQSGDYASAWAENIGTERINVQEYNRLLQAAQLSQKNAETTGDQVATEVQNEAQTVQDNAPAATVLESRTVDNIEATDQESLQVAKESPATEESETVTLDKASEKYGAQAQAMVSTYNEGQDVAKYDAAYQVAYDMGKSGVSISYAMKSDATSYLTEKQRQLAHATGVDAANAKAEAKDAENKKGANGKTGRKKGVVRGDGVTVKELDEAFNTTQSKAYKYLTGLAEATGVDIVLYRSKANANGEYEDAQGKYDRNKPGTLYIDLNAGLRNITDEGKLHRYFMLRTFAHEFTHFIENWNPIQYNEFRKVVFDTMTERGENVHDLIEEKQRQNPGMSYDNASREVVAEAMVDVLPDSNFVQELAQNHKTIFQKLLDKLKEFVENVRAYYNTIGGTYDRGAIALKEQVGDTMKYLDSIVKMWDQIAVQAVENYQKSVATEEVAVSEMETTTTENAIADKTEAVEEGKPAAVETTTSEHGFTITDNAQYGSLEITFDGKPPVQVRDVLKENKFRWNGKKGVWYGKVDRSTITEALNKAFEAETAETATTPAQSEFEKSFWNATQEERDEVVEAINQNTKISHMAPTEIRESADAAVNEEVNANVENVDNPGTVQQSEPVGSGVAPVLDERESGDVPGDGINGGAVADTSERGQQAVRDGGEPDHSERNVRGSGEGSSQSGDLRGSDGVSQEEQSARDYATQNGYGIKLNSLAAKKGMTQVDISDKQNLPTFNPIIINEESDWNKVKDAIDKREAADKAKAEKLHEEVAEQIVQQSTEQPKGRNFVIGDSLDLPNGEKSRYKANIEAIKLVKKLEAEGRYATEAEQTILSKYVGWGGLANAFDQRKADWAKEYTELKELLTDEEYTSARGSTLNAHYTDISVIRAMYDGLKQLGFAGGRMLEPSSGVGNFVGAMPADMASQVRSWTMVELDGITGLIAKHLYPNADVRIQGFEKANIPNNFMDVAISNVPFGNYAVADKAYPKKVTSAIHNYFFAKTLDKVRPGGIVMFITSSYTMNARENTVRRYIMQKADLLGAIRLPDTAFKGNAGTEVVTDILVLKKRADNTAYAGEDFLEAPYQYLSGYNGAYINSYFANHPEMVLGTASFDGGMYRGGNLTYKALEGKGTLADQIREAFKNIQGKMEYPAQLSREKTNFAVERAGKKTKENGLVVKDGKVYRNTNGELVEQNVANGAAERISGMLEIRDAAKELQNYLQQGLNDTEIRKARTKLNKTYDDFVKKHGFINSQTNRNAIKADPDSFSILALENWNPETKKATKSDIFSKNTIAANRTVTSAKDVAEGLIVSVNQTGGVDAALIAKLTGKTEAEVTRELLESRQAFKNRDGQLETAEVYLSGNVRAKLRDAEAMVPMDADYQKNVDALKAVVPEDVGYQDIFVNPGTPWIPDSVYSDFVAYMLGTVNHEWNKAVDVTRSKDTGNFTVELRSKYLKTNSYNTQKWGTSRRSFLDLFDAMLNSKSVVVKDKLDDGSYIINKDATAAANEKIENIQKEFQEWLWKDENRRAELATLYNETFNSVVTPKYNGDNLTVNGANAMKPLRPHQRNAVQRIISSGGNTLLAHKVGAGKTYEMAAAAMKLKQLGLVKKPMFAVPKSLVAQWGNEFMDFFPTAKLLVAEAGDFTAANRKVFMNRIANGDYDAVIVSYEQFEKLPVSDDFTRELYQEQINSVISAIEEAKAEKGGKSLSVKDLEKKRKSLQTKIDKLSDTAKDEGNIDFEQLGVDSIFVDEAHNFKNLFYTTSMTNVSGLGNKDGSKRAFDLYTKVRYLQKLNGGRGIVFATATPVMNSMSEMYIMQKYLQPDLLDQLGLSTFDAWAKQFGEVVNGVEIKPSGQGYRVKQSFSRFKNMSELQLLFRNFADVLTDIPGLKIPKMKGGRVNVVVCEPGQFQQDYMKELEKRADNIKSVDPSVDNMLKITSDGRKISYTQRMIDPTLPYEEGCKIYRCADNVVELYQDSKDINGTQLIFCDMATPKGKSNTATTETDDIETDMESAKLYDDLKARLVNGGIPAKQIAFIHEADTDAKKKKLFADVNDGTVRVLIGSTGKMGVGMNAQKRVVAIHHLDAPWRPGDVEQRNGRAFRQGNINDEVECFTYVTEGSFDARLWDILERKQNFINQVMNGENVGRETEDTGEVTLSAAEVKALASGSPLIMEQVQLDTDIKKLESLYRAHRGAVTNAKSRMEKDKGTIASLEKYITNGKVDLANRVDTYSEGKFSITVGKQKFTEKKDAGVALMAAATAKANETGYTTIGKFAGFDLRVIKTHEGIKGLISGQQGYSFNTYPNNTTFMINHLVAAVEGMSEKVQQWEMQLTETRKDLSEQEKLITQPFAKQAELDQKRARYNEVMEILNPKEEQSLDGVDEDTVQEQSRSYLFEGNEDFALRNSVEKTKDLLAFHNISVKLLLDAIARNSLLMPSLAVTNNGMTDFGEISLVFDKTTIDPSANRKNKLYGADAWTPVQTTLKMNAKFDTNKTVNVVNTMKNHIGSEHVAELLNITPKQFKEAIINADGNIYEAYAHNIGVQAAYGMEKGIISQIPANKDGTVNQEMLQKQLDKTLDSDEGWRQYRRWLNNISDTIITSYDQATNEDVLRHMNAQPATAKPFKLSATGELVVPATEYSSIRELRRNKNRLSDNAAESTKAVAAEFLDFANKIGDTHHVVEAINASFGSRYNIADIMKSFSSYGVDISSREAGELQNLYKKAVELPTQYFEAKPGRDVGLEEIRAAIIPNSPNMAEVKGKLESLGITVVEYEASSNASRLEALNSMDSLKFQQRTDSLTDREVLLKASEEVNTVGWTDGERYALDLFQQSVSKLETLEVERADLGRLYRDQQFGVKVDREAAAKTLNRMKILDGKIEDANSEVLSLENKKVLREVLQKARKVVEAEERQRGDERLKRWRDRRNNADDIKKYRERLRKDVNDLTGWVLHPNNKDIVKHIPDALKSSVIPFLSSIDFTSKQQLRGGDATKADQEFLKRLKGLKSALKPQMNLGDMYEGYTDLPPNFMDRLQSFIDSTQDLVNSNSGEFVVNQMTSDELRELSQVVRTLKEYIQNFNKFHANAMFQHVSEAGDSSIGALEVMGNAGPHTGTVSNFVFWQQMRPAYAFERFGEGGKAIYDGLRRGQAKLAFNTQAIIDFSEKTYTEEEVKAWEKQTKEFTLGGDIVKIPIANIMSFYELSKRPQALGHIIGQGIRVATYKANGKKISDVGHQLNEEDIKTIIGSLTDRQKEVADKLQKFMQDQGGKWGNYVSLKRFGEELFGDEHYFPINSDGRHLQANADEGPSVASLYALLNMGFTKSVTEGANNRLVLYSIFDVFANHMASMAQYNALALPVVDALKWFNYQQKSDPDEDGKRYVLASVRDQMDRVYGVPEETRPGSGRQGYAQTFVVNILKAFNGTEAQGVPTDAIGIEALHRYNVAQVAYNLRVVVQQPLAITRAALLIDYGSIIKGMKLSPAAIQKNIQEMQSHSGIAAWKSLGFYDVNISRGLTDLIKHKDNWMDKVTEVGMWGAEKADLLTWAGIWSACKEEVIKKQRLTPKSEGFYEAVTQLFEEVIYKTQVVDSVLTKNEYLRSKGLFARLTASFMSEPTTTASMLIDAYDKYHADTQRGMTRQQAWKKNARMIGRTAYVYGLSALILSAVQAVADAFRDDDDYEEWYEKWLEAFGGNLIDEAMPFNKLPILSDFYDLAKELLSILGVDTYGNPPQSVFMQWYDSLIKGVEILYDRISGEDTNYTWYGGIYKLLQAAAGITGLPMAAATREITTAWNNIVGAMAPSLKVKTYDAGDKNEIKYAYQDGYLTAEEAAAELLKQGLVDTEDEAYWLIQGWEAGDGYSKYDAILDDVRNGGDITEAMDELTSHGYNEDDVLSQVKSKIGDWYKAGEITKQQAIDMLTKYFDLNSDEITATVNKWSSKVVTGIAYEDIKDEYLSGNITASKAVEMRVRYGGEAQKDASAVVQKWTYEKDTGHAYDDMQELYISGKISGDEAILSMQQYGGVSKADAKATVQKWQCEKDTGYAYDDLQDLYVDGNITAEKAINLRVKYGGEANDDARKTVLKWQCEKDHGVKYSNISSAYLSGDISESTAVSWLVKYGERTQEDAQLAVQAYRWKDKNPEYSDLSDAAIDRYINYCEPSGIKVSVFYEAKKHTSTIEGDGTSGSVKRQYVQYILSLNIPWEQKNAMWHALKISSWKEKDTPFY